MADASYQPKTYRKQGGDQFVVASGGDISVESGGTISNAGTLANTGALANTGTITNSGAGTILDSILSSTLGATLTNYGISTVGTSSGTTSYKLGAPAAGAQKIIVGTTSLGGAATITSTAATIGSTQAAITIAEKGGAIQLVGINTTTWRIVGNSTGASAA